MKILLFFTGHPLISFWISRARCIDANLIVQSHIQWHEESYASATSKSEERNDFCLGNPIDKCSVFETVTWNLFLEPISGFLFLSFTVKPCVRRPSIQLTTEGQPTLKVSKQLGHLLNKTCERNGLDFFLTVSRTLEEHHIREGHISLGSCNPRSYLMTPFPCMTPARNTLLLLTT